MLYYNYITFSLLQLQLFLILKPVIQLLKIIYISIALYIEHMKTSLLFIYIIKNSKQTNPFEIFYYYSSSKVPYLIFPLVTHPLPPAPPFALSPFLVPLPALPPFATIEEDVPIILVL